MESIGAQQQPVARIDRLLQHVRLDPPLHSEIACKQGSVWTLRSLLDRQRTRVEESLNDGVIVRQQSQTTIAQDVRTTVASVPEHNARRIDDETCNDGGTHALAFLAFVRSGEHNGCRRVDGCARVRVPEQG